MTTLGLVTIGQSPRSELTGELERWLPPDVRVVEAGALDDVPVAGRSALAPRSDATTLTTALRDGSSIRVDRDLLVPLVQGAVARVEAQGAAAVVVVCTGPFPALAHRVPLVHAEGLLVHGVSALASGAGTVGVIAPLPEQEQAVADQWRQVLAQQVCVDFADPYASDSAALVRAAAYRLVDRGAEILVLDCMGYSEATRAAAAVAGVPVLLARGLVAALTAELLTGSPVPSRARRTPTSS